ncbi:3-alpha-hydroxysteroid dehydrogenase [Pseudomonas hunanensis]|uniref:3-alpha-hydroxysteroid dehydrogenase n=1 Tax=Pseudomonas hunanensis TaxID=1247546 RepID=A0ABD6MU48_9PSED|nr:SDR family oxidoreductase [Pseudomonas hunanensis]NWL45093.1 3-alpha-hydroxysteroid dehydrogenase [Pseudomonas hunanensis]
MNFNEETVLITGGASGMGASHVRAFHALGANVVIADIASGLGQELSEELGDRALYVHLDVADEGSWRSAVAATNVTFGATSVLINNAGIIGIEALDADDSGLFRKMLDINLTGSYLGIAAVIGDMRKRGGGAIVNIASTAAVRGYPLASAYCASKWGVLGLTKAAALELAHDNIRVNAVLPGPVQTPMTAPHDLSAVLSVQPIARAAQPEEISRMVTFLAHRDSGYITGAEFLVDGGSTLGALPKNWRELHK